MAVGLGLVLRLGAAESTPAIEPGATRDEVVKAYGRPAGESKMGSREVLSFPQGQVTLENGRVVRVEPPRKTPAPASRTPAPAVPVSAPVVAAPVPVPLGHWFTDFEAASREALRRKVQILAVFAGPGDSAASTQFLADVAFHPDFAATFASDYVFFRAYLSAQASAKQTTPDDARWSRLGLSEFPAIVFLTAKGERLAAADFAHPPANTSLRTWVIMTLREVRARLALGATVPAPASVQSQDPNTTSPLEMDRLSPFALSVGIRSARETIVAASVGGLAIALLIGVLLWRTRAKPRPYQGPRLASRISEAASGVPTLPEILAWSKDQVCLVAAVLAESEGYEADWASERDEADLLLTRPGDIQPSVVVCCAPGRSGTVTAKNIRELAGTVTLARAQTGWYVSPAGFSNDAWAFAAQHKLLLIDGAHLIVRLRDLPPILLPKLNTSRPW